MQHKIQRRCPIHKHIVCSDDVAGLRVGHVEIGERVIDTDQVILRIAGERLARFLSEAVEKVGEKQEALTVVRREIRGGIIYPRVQLHVRVLGEYPVCAA